MIYDISQEVFGCEVFPGDERPERKIVSSIDTGEMCNVTAFSMVAHNGTHVDAPYHFYNDGKKLDELELEKFVGPCFVIHHDGEVTADVAEHIMEKACKIGGAECSDRILIGGDAIMTEEGAQVFADYGISLIGNESQTFGPIESPAPIHYILLKSEIVLLEGIRLEHVPEGRYLLCAQPLNLGGADGAPCRPVLITV